MTRGALLSLAVLVAVLVLGGCPSSTPAIPGSERMGTFDFTAQVVRQADGGLDPAWEDCSAKNPSINSNEAPEDDFTFQAIFSRDPSTNEAWITIGGISRKAVFDGQYVDSTFSADRQFQAFDGGGQLTEHFTVALLSRSQSLALGSVCPAEPLDGGLPGPDAGVTLPGPTGNGFDALRACGVLENDVQPPSTCVGCSGCTLRYPVTGVRK